MRKRADFKLEYQESKGARAGYFMVIVPGKTTSYFFNYERTAQGEEAQRKKANDYLKQEVEKAGLEW